MQVVIMMESGTLMELRLIVQTAAVPLNVCMEVYTAPRHNVVSLLFKNNLTTSNHTYSFANRFTECDDVLHMNTIAKI